MTMTHRVTSRRSARTGPGHAVRLCLGIAAGLVTVATAAALPARAATTSPTPSPAPTVPVLGRATVSPATGVDTSSITVATSGPCRQGTNTLVMIYGNGFPIAGFNVSGNSPISIYPAAATGAFAVPLQDNLRHFLDQQGTGRTFSGTYRLAVTCRNRFGPVLAEYDGTIVFAGPHSWRAVNPPPGPSPSAVPSGSGSGTAGAFPAAPSAAPGTPGPGTIDAQATSDSYSLAGVPLPFAVLGLLLVLAGGALIVRGRAADR